MPVFKFKTHLKKMRSGLHGSGAVRLKILTCAIVFPPFFQLPSAMPGTLIHIFEVLLPADITFLGAQKLGINYVYAYCSLKQLQANLLISLISIKIFSPQFLLL